MGRSGSGPRPSCYSDVGGAVGYGAPSFGDGWPARGGPRCERAQTFVHVASGDGGRWAQGPIGADVGPVSERRETTTSDPEGRRKESEAEQETVGGPRRRGARGAGPGWRRRRKRRRRRRRSRGPTSRVSGSVAAGRGEGGAAGGRAGRTGPRVGPGAGGVRGGAPMDGGGAPRGERREPPPASATTGALLPLRTRQTPPLTRAVPTLTPRQERLRRGEGSDTRGLKQEAGPKRGSPLAPSKPHPLRSPRHRWD